MPSKLNVGVKEVTGNAVSSRAEKVVPSRTNSMSFSRSGLFSFSREKVLRAGAMGVAGVAGGSFMTGSGELLEPPPQPLINAINADATNHFNMSLFTLTYPPTPHFLLRGLSMTVFI